MSEAKANSSTEEFPLIASPYDLRVSLGECVSQSDIQAALDTGQTGFVHSFTTGSTVDGPGVRVVAWLTGCQFRCLYCHNPDTWKMTNGLPVTVERATEVLRQYRHGLGVMKGGVTISGGEPLMQHRFVLNVFSAAKKLGIHTALDTNGYLAERLSDENLNVVDLVLLDLKAISSDLHRKLTGMDNAPVLAFAERLSKLQRPIWVRFVLVPGYTDDPEEVGRLSSFVAQLGNVERVDVLPFHQMGKFKWERLGIPYELANLNPPSASETKTVVEKFRAAGLKAF